MNIVKLRDRLNEIIERNDRMTEGRNNEEDIVVMVERGPRAKTHYYPIRYAGLTLHGFTAKDNPGEVSSATHRKRAFVIVVEESERL